MSVADALRLPGRTGGRDDVGKVLSAQRQVRCPAAVCRLKDSSIDVLDSPAAVLAALAGTAAFFFWLERFTGWRLFRYLVPMIWIYATPMLLRNVGVFPESSPAYDVLRQYGLPCFIVLLLLSANMFLNFLYVFDT